MAQLILLFLFQVHILSNVPQSSMTLIEVDHESKIIDLKTEPGDILDESNDNDNDQDNEDNGNEDFEEEEIDFEGQKFLSLLLPKEVVPNL